MAIQGGFELMSWEKVKLGDIAASVQTGPFGSQLHQSDYSEFGTPVVMPKDMIGGKILEDSIARVEEQHVNRLSRHKVNVGDILYARRGDVGKCALVTENEKGWLCGTGCLKVTIDFSKANPKFVFYQLQKPETVGWVEKHAVGATMLNLNTGILESIPIELPKLNEQNKIVDILSAYDNLIENNQKQIKLLEEAAQRLYKQWFIDLRYPGHETTPIVDGVPEGWRKGIVGEIAEFKRGKVITKAQVAEGNIPVVAGGLEPAYYHNTANTTAPVITVSGSGANAGFAQLYNENVFASDCSFADINTTPYVYFVYCLLKDKKTELDSLQKGAAQPHVYAKDINALATLLPPEEMLKLYTKYASPYFEKVKALKEQIKNLTQSRDRLLPKLMNGELEV